MRDASQFPRFSDDEMASRHERVNALMDERELDAILFFGAGQFNTDVYWLTDWPGGRETYVLFQAGAEPLVISQLFNHVPMAKVLSVIKDVRWAGANTAATMSGILGERGLSRKKIGLVGVIHEKRTLNPFLIAGPGVHQRLVGPHPAVEVVYRTQSARVNEPLDTLQGWMEMKMESKCKHAT